MKVGDKQLSSVSKRISFNPYLSPALQAFTTRQFWSIERKAEGSESLPYGRKTHKTVKVSSGEPAATGEEALHGEGVLVTASA